MPRSSPSAARPSLQSRSVAFRPYLTVGLALSQELYYSKNKKYPYMFTILQIFHKSNDKHCVNEISHVEHKKMGFMA